MSTTVLEEQTTATTADFIALEEKLRRPQLPPAGCRRSAAAKASGSGTSTASKYLDFLAAYSAVNQGHRHPEILAALMEQAQKVTLTSRAFRNDQLGPFYQAALRALRLRSALPMNTRRRGRRNGAQAGAQVGLRGQGHPRRHRPRSSPSPTTSTAAPSPSSASPPRRTTGTASAPSPPASSVSPMATPTPSSAPSPQRGGRPRRAHPGRGRHRHPARGLSQAPARDHPAAQRAADRRRDPVRPRPHRQDVRLRARGHPARRGHRRQGPVGRLLPGLGILADESVMGVFQPGEHGSTFGGNPLAAAVGRAALRVAGRREDGRELRRAWVAYFMERLRTIHRSPHQGGARPGPVDRHRAAPRGRRRPPLLRGAAAAKGCSARRPTTTSSASRRP